MCDCSVLLRIKRMAAVLAKSLRYRSHVTLVVLNGLSVTAAHATTMTDLLAHIGIQSSKQCHALAFILRQVGIAWACDPMHPSTDAEKDVVKEAIAFVDRTQNTLVRRSNGQERWQVQPPPWSEALATPEIHQAMRELGLVEAIVPMAQSADVLAILGATLPTMLERLVFAEVLMRHGFSAQKMLLVTGVRKATEGVDGTADELAKIARAQGIADPQNLSETDLLLYAFAQSPLSQRAWASVNVIDTQQRHLHRATTETTTEDVVQWLAENPEVKSVVFVSSQPHVRYQEGIMRAVFNNKNVTIDLKWVGPAITDVCAPQALADGLGGMIWAQMPHAMRALGMAITEKVAWDALQDLYKGSRALTQLLQPLAPKDKTQDEVVGAQKNN